MTPGTRSQEAVTLRVLRWYGLGASTRSTVWAGFRRTTITTAVLTLLTPLIVSPTPGESFPAEVLYVVPAVWVAFVAVVTLPGIVRAWQHRSHS